MQPLKESRAKNLIPDKTNRKAVLLDEVVPVWVTVIVGQVAVPCVTRIAVTGTPKDRIATLIVERTIIATVTLRECIKAAAVVKALLVAWCSCVC